MQRHINTFAVDNEGFRYLIAAGHDMHHQWKWDFDAFAHSWKRSTQELINMLKNISKLEPKATRTVIELNQSYISVHKLCHVSKRFSEYI